MRALTIDYEHRDLRMREVPEPEIETEDGVLFRVLEAGICGTDRSLAAFEFGSGPPGSSFLILGHEAIGEVVRTGPAVSDLKPGDLVVPSVRRACVPACLSCRRHRRDLCLTGSYTERGILGEHGYFVPLAVDRREDLIPIPRELRAVAVLLEPLSVVEKALLRALQLHGGEPRTGLVLGAGPVGLLAAMAMRLRGLEVDVVSPEAATSRRARLAEEAGARYLAKPERTADIVIEAAGVPAALSTGMQAMAPLGVLAVLGAMTVERDLSLLRLILGNGVVFGSVNASPEGFARGVEDLRRMPASVLRGMIERLPLKEYGQTLGVPSTETPKIVHVVN